MSDRVRAWGAMNPGWAVVAVVADGEVGASHGKWEGRPNGLGVGIDVDQSAAVSLQYPDAVEARGEVALGGGLAGGDPHHLGEGGEVERTTSLP